MLKLCNEGKVWVLEAFHVHSTTNRSNLPKSTQILDDDGCGACFDLRRLVVEGEDVWLTNDSAGNATYIAVRDWIKRLGASWGAGP